MAAQTDAPDDLIAELARLMADDAKAAPPPAHEKAAPVRIPGDAGAAPAPRFDFSASSKLASTRAPASPVRIPGAESEPAKTSDPVDPFSFDFDFLTPKPAAPAPQAAPEPAAPAPVEAASAPTPQDEAVPLDQDSLADLIAAELAADLGSVEIPEAPVEQAAPVPVQRAATPDSFGVPPVFGLGSARPAAASPVNPVLEPQPTIAVPPPAQPVQAAMQARAPEPELRNDDAAMDPLDEIERLIGPAVRNAAPTPAPALRSLATPVAAEPVVPSVPQPEPRSRVSAPAPQPSVSVSSVDEAILAAAAATGAHVEWVNAASPEVADLDDDVEPMAAPVRSRGFHMSRAVAGPLVALGLLAVAGFGLYWVLGQGGGATGPAPVIVADTTPVKEVPEVDTSASAQQSVVFNEISGGNAGVEEQIVSRDQADTDAVVAANTPGSTSGVMTDGSGTAIDPNQDGLVNRKVRTVTVRPDGTIVSGDDSMAGTAILPVDRPNVPEVPGADFSTPDLIASATAEAEAATATSALPVVPATPAAPAAEPGSVIAVVDAAGAPVAGRSVTIPMQRPSDFAATSAAAIAAANAAPAPAPLAAAPAVTPVATTPVADAPVAPAPTGAAAAYVQMASQRSEADAQATVQAITTRYGVLFGGATPQIQRADLGERGIYYRVLIPAASRESAANICTNVKAAGGDCLLL